MDKQKQIEEMVKDMFDYSRTLVNIKTATEDSAFINRYKETLKGYAKYLVKQGYIKPPENAVVLTSGDKVDMFDSEASGFMTSPIGDLPLNIGGMRKAVDEIARLLIVQAELQDLNAKYYNEAKDLRRKLNNDGAIYSRLEVDGFIDKARKEAAEKFAERLKESKTIKAIFGEGWIFSYVEVCKAIDKICKEFTEKKE